MKQTEPAEGWIDLTQLLYPKMMIYPGDPEVASEAVCSHQKDGCHVTRLSMGMHTGTHVDAPYHVWENGKKIMDFSLNDFWGEGQVLDLSGLPAGTFIEKKALAGAVDKNLSTDFLCIRTGWEKYYETEKYFQHPVLSLESACFLRDLGVRLLGMDTPGPEATFAAALPIHRCLLGENILLAENLRNLNRLQPGILYEFSLFPLALANGEGSPVRAAARERWKRNV